MSVPVFEVRASDGKLWCIYEDGQVSGFPDGCTVINRIPGRLNEEIALERIKSKQPFVIDFPKFDGDPQSLPKADVLWVEMCADGSVIYESDGRTSVELPVTK